jgi:PadR family transcriptional regulator PadR
VLELCVLRIINEGPTYGYAIASALEAAGLGAPKGGTLYPLLARLQRDDLVTVEWREGEGGPGRKFYELTQTGRTELIALTAEWSVFAARVSALLATHAPSAVGRVTSQSAATHQAGANQANTAGETDPAPQPTRKDGR